MTQPVVSIEGTTRWMRDEKEPEHVYAYAVDLEPFEWIGPYRDTEAWLNKALHSLPENARIRITVEVVEANRPCPTKTPEPHWLGEFPMTCYRCHLEADS